MKIKLTRKRNGETLIETTKKDVEQKIRTAEILTDFSGISKKSDSVSTTRGSNTIERHGRLFDDAPNSQKLTLGDPMPQMFENYISSLVK